MIAYIKRRYLVARRWFRRTFDRQCAGIRLLFKEYRRYHNKTLAKKTLNFYHVQYLNTKITIKGTFQLDREYTWIKCNRNFNGFYMTDYFNKDFEAFEKLIKNNDDEKVDGRICFFLKRIVYIFKSLKQEYMQESISTFSGFRQIEIGLFIWIFRKILKTLVYLEKKMFRPLWRGSNYIYILFDDPIHLK